MNKARLMVVVLLFTMSGSYVHSGPLARRVLLTHGLKSHALAKTTGWALSQNGYSWQGGNRITFLKSKGRGNDALWRMQLGTNPAKLTKLTAITSKLSTHVHENLVLSPDGSRIVMGAYTRGGIAWEVFDVATGKRIARGPVTSPSVEFAVSHRSSGWYITDMKDEQKIEVTYLEASGRFRRLPAYSVPGLCRRLIGCDSSDNLVVYVRDPSARSGPNRLATLDTKDTGHSIKGNRVRAAGSWSLPPSINTVSTSMSSDGKRVAWLVSKAGITEYYLSGSDRLPAVVIAPCEVELWLTSSDMSGNPVRCGSTHVSAGTVPPCYLRWRNKTREQAVTFVYKNSLREVAISH
jgi:hypothetical protein